MFEQFRNKHLYKKTQIVVLNTHGVVLQSDDFIFKIEANSAISNFHPFFETINSLLETKDFQITFSCIHIEFNNIKKTIDVIFNSGSNDESPFLILIDFTEHYDNFQSIAQEKNESILSFHLSELKNQQLEHEKNFKNKFLANVSHDLKTPIWGLKCFLNYLEKTELSEVQVDYVQTLKYTTNHINHLVQDLVDLSKIESGQMELNNKKFNLIDSINNLTSIVKPKALKKKLDFNVTINAISLNAIIGDNVRIIQILINLLDNAIKFTKKGSIILEINDLSLENNIAQIQFLIKDTGTGIVSSQKSDAFQSFNKLHKSKKIDGLGLGLSIVSNLVRLMNGKIDYQTEIGKGTSFEVILPIRIDK